jgi:DNA-binding beta-propeller fold protein YncE
MLKTIPVLRGPTSMAYTPGILWTVNGGANRVTWIDAQTGQLLGEPFRTGQEPSSMAVGDGSVWVVNHDSGTLTRIDPETSEILVDIPLEWDLASTTQPPLVSVPISFLARGGR